MRGDSVRDLYAKAIALAGLALLAVAGALFDYWPVATELPRIAGPVRSVPLENLPHVLPSAETLLAELERRQPAPVVRREQGSRTRQSDVAAPVTTASTATPMVALAVMAASPVALTRMGSPLTLTPPPPAAAAPTPVDPVEPVDDMTLPVVPARFVELPRANSTYFVAAPPVEDDPTAIEMVTGAFKKTGTVLMRTGVKTGATIRDALLRVGGAFRKVL